MNAGGIHLYIYKIHTNFNSNSFTNRYQQWMDAHENEATHNLAETCCASISLDDLAAMSEDKNAPVLGSTFLSTKMTYGEIPGSKELRGNLANLYSSKVGMFNLLYNDTKYMLMQRKSKCTLTG
jgi:hypothetical protein